MRKTVERRIEKFEHEGIRYRRITNNAGEPPTWEFYNMGYGERGWVPVKGNSSAGVVSEETLEDLYSNL